MLGEPQTFAVQVTPLRNLPLDLYILMDLSHPMSDELQSVKDISDQIGELGYYTLTRASPHCTLHTLRCITYYTHHCTHILTCTHKYVCTHMYAHIHIRTHTLVELEASQQMFNLYLGL